jgi:hypothetical protein
MKNVTGLHFQKQGYNPENSNVTFLKIYISVFYVLKNVRLQGYSFFDNLYHWHENY